MAGYRIMSILQFIFIIFAGLVALDLAIDFGLNTAFFGAPLGAGWWSTFAFFGYLFAAVAILQLVKAITVED